MRQPDRLLAYRLLTRKGEWDVDAFLAEIPTTAFDELRAYMEEIEPQGFPIEDRRYAETCATLAHAKSIKPWLHKPPDYDKLSRKGKRRRLDGTLY